MDKKLYIAFDAVKSTDRFKESVRNKAIQSPHSPSYGKTMRIHRPLTACACLAILLIGIITLYCIPVAAIEVENDPVATTLTVNCFNRVLHISGTDTGGHQHKHYQQVINSLLSTNEEETDAVITVIGKDSLLSEVENCVNGHTSVHCYNADRHTAEQAENCGLSVAKYNIYLQLIDKGIQITTDEVCNTGMHHLRELLEQNDLQTNTDTPASDSSASECQTQESCGATAHNEANQHHANGKQHGKYK